MSRRGWVMATATCWLIVCSCEPQALHAGDGSATALGPSPADMLTSFQHDPVVRVEFAAAEPVVRDPVALCFDETGRLFVAEMGDYPIGPGDDPQAVSRIVRLADRDGDGEYDSREVFADNLSFVTGLTPWQGGLVVTLAGEVCWLADTDGDGRANTRETWFRGFTEENSQLRANHPTLAPDGTFYVANGLRGGEVVASDPRWQPTTSNEPLSIRGHDFRFDPFGRPFAPGDSSFEAVSGHGQFGLSIDDFGTRFLCSNRNPCMQVMLEERDLRRNPAAAISTVVHDVSPAGEQSRIFPISSGWTTSNLHAGQFSAACGVTIHRGHGLPEAFRGNAFTCDPTGNLVHRQRLESSGPAFTCLPREREQEFLASTHDWFRPVALADGPDGCLYVIDMARAVIEHPQFMPDELKTRPDLLHGRNRGRLWRITATDHPQQQRPLSSSFAAATPQELVDLLAHPNGWHRDTAARLLLENPESLPHASLQALARTGMSPEARSRALWLLARADRSTVHPEPALDTETLAAALADRDAAVRRVAVRVSADAVATNEMIRQLVLTLADDVNARVRYEVALRLGDMPDGALPPDDENALVDALASILARDPADPWMTRGVATAAAGRSAAILNSLLPRLRDARTSQEAMASCTETFAELAAAGGEAAETGDVALTLAAEIRSHAAGPASQMQPAFAFVTGLGQGVARRRESLAAAASQWPASLRTAIDRIITTAADAATNDALDHPTRLRAIACLSHASARDAVETLAGLVGPGTPQDLRLAAITASRRHHNAGLDTAMLADFGSQTPAVHRAVVEALVAWPDSAERLLAALEAKDLPLQLTDAQWQRLAGSSDEAPARVAALRSAATPEARQEVVARYQTALVLTGHIAAGRDVFRNQCSSCHRVGDIGVDVGPDISDSRVKQPAQYLSDILDPNRAIDANFFSYTLLTTDGRLLTGLVTAETGSSVTLRQPDGVTVTLLRDEIDELRSTGRSLMPVGLEQTISPQQMADLIAFLKNWRYETAAVTTSPATP